MGHAGRLAPLSRTSAYLNCDDATFIDSAVVALPCFDDTGSYRIRQRHHTAPSWYSMSIYGNQSCIDVTMTYKMRISTRTALSFYPRLHPHGQIHYTPQYFSSATRKMSGRVKWKCAIDMRLAVGPRGQRQNNSAMRDERTPLGHDGTPGLFDIFYRLYFHKAPFVNCYKMWSVFSIAIQVLPHDVS